MGLFDRKERKFPSFPEPEVIEDNIPVAQFDLTKRYDIHAQSGVETRLYEDVRIVGVRTLEKRTAISGGVIGGYLEIETPDGRRAWIPVFHVTVLCKHGAAPAYKVIAERKPESDAGK